MELNGLEWCKNKNLWTICVICIGTLKRNKLDQNYFVVFQKLIYILSLITSSSEKINIISIINFAESLVEQSLRLIVKNYLVHESTTAGFTVPNMIWQFSYIFSILWCCISAMAAWGVQSMLACPSKSRLLV